MNKKWLALGLVSLALVLIPRRSSRQDTTATDDLASNKPSDKHPKPSNDNHEINHNPQS